MPTLSLSTLSHTNTNTNTRSLSSLLHGPTDPLVAESEAMNGGGTATFRSILDKPLSQLTEDDISQLTREDCRRFLKEKGLSFFSLFLFPFLSASHFSFVLAIFIYFSAFILLLLHDFRHLQTSIFFFYSQCCPHIFLNNILIGMRII